MVGRGGGTARGWPSDVQAACDLHTSTYPPTATVVGYCETCLDFTNETLEPQVIF